jgi:hypothetical protein
MAHPDLLHIASNVLLISAWALGIGRIWRYRRLEHANQVLAAALAMVLSNSLMMADFVPKDVLAFFNMLSQLVMITAFAQVFKSLHKKTKYDLHESTKEHMVTLLGLGGAGVFGIFMQYLFLH